MALSRSTSDKMVWGVCSGIAKEYNLDVSLVRVLMVLFAVFGIGALVYLVMWLVVPNENGLTGAQEMQNRQG